MLRNKAKIINMSAISWTEVDKETNTGTPTMKMFGTIDLSRNTFDTSTDIMNLDLYNKHFEEVENDYAQFRRLVKEELENLSKGMKAGD